MSKNRFLLKEDPIESIKHIREIDGISKEIWLTLDNTGNLDAKVYLFFSIVLSDRKFVKENLGEYKNIDTMTPQELYILAEKFKNKLNIHEGEENKYPISEYGINLYHTWLEKKRGRQENLKKWIHIHRDHIEEDFEEKIIKTNTLLGQDFDISQRIGEKPIIQLIESFTNFKNESFYNFFKRLGGGEPDFNQNVDKNINAHSNLLYYIQAETKKGEKMESLEMIKLHLKVFFTNVNNMYFTLLSLYNSNTGKNNSQYNAIKEIIKNKYTENGLEVELVDPAEKEFERAFTKLLSKYGGKVFKLKDLHRCSFVFQDLNSMVQWINLLLQSLHNKRINPLLKRDKERNPIIELEDKIGLLLSNSWNKSGYRDIDFIIHFSGNSGLIPMEIQFHLQDTKKAKKEGVPRPYDLVSEFLTHEEIEHINEILRENTSIDYLPTNNEQNLSADNLYHITRKFKDGKISPELIGKIREVEKAIHDWAWKAVLLKLQIFDTLGNTHPLGKNFKKIQEEHNWRHLH